ncbi:MAG: DUF4893 domain-containing protein [Sphingomonas sp.]
MALTPKLRPLVSVDPVPAEGSWRSVATQADQVLVDDLPKRWLRALASVPKTLAAKVKAEGALLDPEAAKVVQALPIGPYRCRLVRLGGSRGFATFRPDFCYVDGDTARRSFTKQDGQILPGGWLYADGDAREVFLGAMRKQPSDLPPPYGESADSDVVGVVERVAPFRWRLILPKAKQGAILDIYELVPVPPEVPETP